MSKQNKTIIFGIILILICLITYSLLAKNYVISPNEASRLASVYSLVEQKTWCIDNTPYFWTIDKIKIDDHFYSDKPPLLSFIMAGWYYYVKKSISLSFAKSEALTYYGLCLTFSVLPSLLIILLIYVNLIKSGFAVKEAFFYSSLTAFTTLQFPYSLVINNQIAAALFLTVVYLLFEEMFFSKKLVELTSNNLLIEKKSNILEKNLWFELSEFFVLGLFLSLLFAIDHLTGSIFLVIFSISFFFVIAKQNEARKTIKITAFIIGVSSILIINFTLNFIISDSLIPLSQQYEHYNYAGSYLQLETPAGKLAHSNIVSVLKYLFQLLFGIRGLFSYTPILLLSIFYIIKQIKSKSEYAFLIKFFSVGILITIFTVSLVSKNYGGSAYGVRWFLPFTPILMIWVSRFCKNIRWNSLKISFCIIAVLISFITAIVGCYEPWTQLHGNNFTFINNFKALLNL